MTEAKENFHYQKFVEQTSVLTSQKIPSKGTTPEKGILYLGRSKLPYIQMKFTEEFLMEQLGSSKANTLVGIHYEKYLSWSQNYSCY